MPWRCKVCPTREVSLKGKAQYGWPPSTNQFKTVPFCTENIINLFYIKQATLIRRSIVPSLPPQLVFPGPIHDVNLGRSMFTPTIYATVTTPSKLVRSFFIFNSTGQV